MGSSLRNTCLTPHLISQCSLLIADSFLPAVACNRVLRPTLGQKCAGHMQAVREHFFRIMLNFSTFVAQNVVDTGYEGKVKIGMDVAASEFYTEDKMYDLDFKTADNDGSQKKTGAQMQDMYKSFVENYPVVSIEDPFDQVCFKLPSRGAATCCFRFRTVSSSSVEGRPCKLLIWSQHWSNPVRGEQQRCVTAVSCMCS